VRLGLSGERFQRLGDLLAVGGAAEAVGPGARGVAVVVLREMGDVRVELGPVERRLATARELGVYRGERVLDELRGTQACGAGVCVEREADEGVAGADQRAHGGVGCDGVREVAVDAAQAVVEGGRAVDRDGDYQTGADCLVQVQDGPADTLGGEPVGREVDEEEVGAVVGKGLDDLEEVGRSVGSPPVKSIQCSCGLAAARRQISGSVSSAARAPGVSLVFQISQ
jgi:hypothetical protein